MAGASRKRQGGHQAGARKQRKQPQPQSECDSLTDTSNGAITAALGSSPRDGVGSVHYTHYHADYNTGMNTIHAGGEMESYLLLPVIPPAAAVDVTGDKQ